MFSNSVYNEVSFLFIIDLGGFFLFVDLLGILFQVGILYIGVVRYKKFCKYLKNLKNGDLVIGWDEIVKIGEINYQ